MVGALVTISGNIAPSVRISLRRWEYRFEQSSLEVSFSIEKSVGAPDSRIDDVFFVEAAVIGFRAGRWPTLDSGEASETRNRVIKYSRERRAVLLISSGDLIISDKSNRFIAWKGTRYKRATLVKMI